MVIITSARRLMVNFKESYINKHLLFKSIVFRTSIKMAPFAKNLETIYFSTLLFVKHSLC